MAQSATAGHSLNTSGHGDSATSLGSPFHRLIPLDVQKRGTLCPCADTEDATHSDRAVRGDPQRHGRDSPLFLAVPGASVAEQH